MAEALRRGAILLCGGKSSRMGQPKHLLPFGDEVVLQRVARSISEVAEEIVIVASQGQKLPKLPENCLVVRDDVGFQGPLSGLFYGLRALPRHIDAVYLTGCDVPLLKTSFVRAVFAELEDAEIAVPFDDNYLHPLAAVYRTSLLSAVEKLLQEDEKRPRMLIHSAQSKKIPVSQLQLADPELDSLKNMNSPEDYEALLRRAGLVTD